MSCEEKVPTAPLDVKQALTSDKFGPPPGYTEQGLYPQIGAGGPQYSQGVSQGMVYVPTTQPANVTLLVPGQPGDVVIARERKSFVRHIVFSCVVFWLCCWPLGLTAFILALLANNKSSKLDELSQKEAARFGTHAMRTCIAGIILGIIFWIIFIIRRVSIF